MPGDTTPSPNSYSLPQLIGNKVPTKHASAAFSMTARSKTGSFAEDLAKTPGPGHYRILDPNVVKRRGPAYSILGRSYMPGGKFNLEIIVHNFLNEFIKNACIVKMFITFFCCELRQQIHF